MIEFILILFKEAPKIQIISIDKFIEFGKIFIRLIVISEIS